MFDREQEQRIGDYAKSCCDATTTTNALRSMSCSFFYRLNISFSASCTYECRLEYLGLCVEGPLAA